MSDIECWFSLSVWTVKSTVGFPVFIIVVCSSLVCSTVPIRHVNDQTFLLSRYLTLQYNTACTSSVQCLNKLWCESTTNPTPVLRIAALRTFSELTKTVIRSSHGHSTPSLKISCKSVQPFSRNLAEKETKESIENNTPSPILSGHVL